MLSCVFTICQIACLLLATRPGFIWPPAMLSLAMDYPFWVSLPASPGCIKAHFGLISWSPDCPPHPPGHPDLDHGRGLRLFNLFLRRLASVSAFSRPAFGRLAIPHALSHLINSSIFHSLVSIASPSPGLFIRFIPRFPLPASPTHVYFLACHVLASPPHPRFYFGCSTVSLDRPYSNIWYLCLDR